MRLNRFRKKRKRGGFLPVLIPVMNLFLLILPLTIQNAYLQKMTTLEMQLPSISESGAGSGGANILLDLKADSISVYLNDFLIFDTPADEGFESRLAVKLKELKTGNPSKKDILIKVAPLVKYELAVKVMDECKKDGGLFPDVVFLDEVK